MASFSVHGFPIPFTAPRIFPPTPRICRSDEFPNAYTLRYSALGLVALFRRRGVPGKSQCGRQPKTQRACVPNTRPSYCEANCAAAVPLHGFPISFTAPRISPRSPDLPAGQAPGRLHAVIPRPRPCCLVPVARCARKKPIRKATEKAMGVCSEHTPIMTWNKSRPQFL